MLYFRDVVMCFIVFGVFNSVYVCCISFEGAFYFVIRSLFYKRSGLFV